MYLKNKTIMAVNKTRRKKINSKFSFPPSYHFVCTLFSFFGDAIDRSKPTSGEKNTEHQNVVL